MITLYNYVTERVTLNKDYYDFERENERTLKS